MKKTLSLILVFLICLTSLPVMASAEEQSATNSIINVYTSAAFAQALEVENASIILWQDVELSDSVSVQCASIDLNGYSWKCESTFTIAADNGEFSIIDSKYNKNTHTSTGSTVFSNGIDIGNNTLMIQSGVITVYGTYGKTGYNSSANGGTGGTGGRGSDAIYGTGNIIFYNGTITVYGGDGGEGGTGGNGTNGRKEYYALTASRDITYPGNPGGTGGKGGNGGYGINVTDVSVFGGNIQVFGGYGGDGGRGGEGGHSYSLGSGIETGEGGVGGQGGSGGYGESAIYAASVYVYNGTLVCEGKAAGGSASGGRGGCTGGAGYTTTPPSYIYPVYHKTFTLAMTIKKIIGARQRKKSYTFLCSFESSFVLKYPEN